MKTLMYTWRDFTYWLRTQIVPEPCCACCWEIPERTDRHLCSSLPLSFPVDLVIVSSGPETGAGLADVSDAHPAWKNGTVWRAPRDARDGAALPVEASLHRHPELAACYIVAAHDDGGAFVLPDPRDYFTPNAMPLLIHADDSNGGNDASAFFADVRAYAARRGCEFPSGVHPDIFAYGQNKEDAGIMLDFFREFVHGRTLTRYEYACLHHAWCFAFQKGIA